MATVKRKNHFKKCAAHTLWALKGLLEEENEVNIAEVVSLALEATEHLSSAR